MLINELTFTTQREETKRLTLVHVFFS